jgi:prepilin-type processing-associated H-X9-DG protein
MIMDAGVYNMNPTGNVRNVQVPSTTPLIGNNQYLPGVGDVGTTVCAPSGTSAAQYDCQSGRHFGGVNMAFADGHVKWLKTDVVMAENRKTNIPAGCGALVQCTQYNLGAWNVLNTL